jgi:glutamate synthase domain-containing protein 2
LILQGIKNMTRNETLDYVRNAPFPVRYGFLCACAIAFILTFTFWFLNKGGGFFALMFGALTALGLRDLRQRKHAILRNYPILGHLRFFFEFVRPEIRQYFIEGDQDEKPFSRAQRSIVYQRAKGEADKRPFGTQMDVGAEGFEWVNHSMAPSKIESEDFRVTIGAGRAQPYAASVFNISAMSFGALNKGAKLGGFYHDTGEGSVSEHHRVHGGDIVWEIGSGYFGCRNDDGTFNAERYAAAALEPQVKMIELKLSQGAKPGHGGVLPGAKVTIEIANARGVKEGVDCVSPAKHSAFNTPLEMLQFIDKLRELSGGKPVGFKFCLGHPWEWFAVCKAMLASGITPDFIVVDGKEGGTGAAPLEFTDHVGTPLQEGLLLVHNTLVGLNLRDKIKLGASGKIVTSFDIARTLALGADWCNSARGFMFALGCIQAQSCHTGTCPTGVTTQDPLRQRALVVPDKAERVASFHANTLKALKELLEAAGLNHPSELMAHHIVRRVNDSQIKLLSTLFPFVERGELLKNQMPHRVFELYWPLAQAESFAANGKLIKQA